MTRRYPQPEQYVAPFPVEGHSMTASSSLSFETTTVAVPPLPAPQVVSPPPPRLPPTAVGAPETPEPPRMPEDLTWATQRQEEFEAKLEAWRLAHVVPRAAPLPPPLPPEKPSVPIWDIFRGLSVPPQYVGAARGVLLAMLAAGAEQAIRVIPGLHLSPSVAVFVPVLILALRTLEGIADGADSAKTKGGA